MIDGRPYLDVEFIVTEPLYVTLVSAEFSRYLVRDAGGRYAVIVGYDGDCDGGTLTFNGEFVDVGDDLPVYLGALDAAAEAGEGVTVYEEAPSE